MLIKLFVELLNHGSFKTVTGCVNLYCQFVAASLLGECLALQQFTDLVCLLLVWTGVVIVKSFVQQLLRLLLRYE